MKKTFFCFFIWVVIHASAQSSDFSLNYEISCKTSDQTDIHIKIQYNLQNNSQSNAVAKIESLGENCLKLKNLKFYSSNESFSSEARAKDINLPINLEAKIKSENNDCYQIEINNISGKSICALTRLQSCDENF